jgi:hypothetical protein
MTFDPAYRNAVAGLLPKNLRAKYESELTKISDEHKELANSLYNTATDQKVIFSLPCDNPEPVRAGKSHSCVLSSMILKIPTPLVYKQFIYAPDYHDPQVFLQKVHRELRSAP